MADVKVWKGGVGPWWYWRCIFHGHVNICDYPTHAEALAAANAHARTHETGARDE